MENTHDLLNLKEEVRRIREVYAERKEERVSEWIPYINLYGRYVYYERTAMLIQAIRQSHVKTLAGMKMLDVGCGSGTLLRYLFDFGAKPKDCFGIDVLEHTLVGAKELCPNLGFSVASAARLPFADGTFDMVFQSMLFTSVLDPKIKEAIASEMLRVLRKRGRFVWYDFIYDNPQNKNVKGIGRREIRGLLTGSKLRFWRLTLAPPIGRILGGVSPFMFHLLSQVPFLCTHYLCIAEKQ
ncbi:MAG TPA: class I SAM-dependent methyltransferase [Candidatus Acidoferrum sp.]|nr:class I SAM-dependent methyltransferase [Candidatus Acidoferrum sp.]